MLLQEVKATSVLVLNFKTTTNSQLSDSKIWISKDQTKVAGEAATKMISSLPLTIFLEQEIHTMLEVGKLLDQRSNNTEVTNNNSTTNMMIILINNNKSLHGIREVTSMIKITVEDHKEAIQFLDKELNLETTADLLQISHLLNYMLHLVARVAFNSSEQRC